MTTSTFLIICICSVVLTLGIQARFIPKGTPHYMHEERLPVVIKRPFCNMFSGCLGTGGRRKRSNLPALTDKGEEADEYIGSLLELSAEPAVEDLSRQIMSEAKLWEAIQEANLELNRRKQAPVSVPDQYQGAPSKTVPTYI